MELLMALRYAKREMLLNLQFFAPLKKYTKQKKKDQYNKKSRLRIEEQGIAVPDLVL